MEVPIVGRQEEKQIRFAVKPALGNSTVQLMLEGLGTLNISAQVARSMGVGLISAAAISEESEHMKTWAERVAKGVNLNEQLKKKIIEKGMA